MTPHPILMLATIISFFSYLGFGIYHYIEQYKEMKNLGKPNFLREQIFNCLGLATFVFFAMGTTSWIFWLDIFLVVLYSHSIYKTYRNSKIYDKIADAVYSMSQEEKLDVLLSHLGISDEFHNTKISCEDMEGNTLDLGEHFKGAFLINPNIIEEIVKLHTEYFLPASLNLEKYKLVFTNEKYKELNFEATVEQKDKNGTKYLRVGMVGEYLKELELEATEWYFLITDYKVDGQHDIYAADNEEVLFEKYYEQAIGR